MSDENLGDFDEFAEDSEEEQPDDEQSEEVVTIPDVEDEDAAEQVAEQLEATGEQGRRTVLQGVEKASPVEDNPLNLDPRVGLRDVCYDRAKPGAKVQVVDCLAETVEDYYEGFPDAPALDEYAGNVVAGMRETDAVFACVYLKDVLTSVDTKLTAYPMPESRLTRYPIEQASMVGSSSVEFERTRLPGEDDTLVNVPCGCGDYEVYAPTGTLEIDVICPECGNHFGQGTASVEDDTDDLPEEVEQRLQEVFDEMVEDVPERDLKDTQPGQVAGSAAKMVALEFDMNAAEVMERMDVQELLSTDDEDEEGSA